MSDRKPETSTAGSSRKPVCLIVLGMAGSGKTTFVDALIRHLMASGESVYAINLDPAVHHVPYSTNIDIRDTVKFKEVMKQYGFGPNGAIMTSLNFFASQFNKVVDLINKNAENLSFVVLDTPGQIEVFTWSASGSIISDSLGSSFPTLVIYVIDTPRSHNPVTFMSNMLYACSVLYRMSLPFLVVLNKTDIIDCGFAIEWMRDFEVFQEALSAYRSEDGTGTGADEHSAYSGTSPYMIGLVNSMSLVLDEFYNQLPCCGVSSVSGDGMDQVVREVNSAVKEYNEVYAPLLEKRRSKIHGSKTDVHDVSGSGDACLHVKQSEPPSKAHKPMLVDLAGDCDDVDNDALIEVDGQEERSESDDEDTERIDENFRRQCVVSSRAAKSENSM